MLPLLSLRDYKSVGEYDPYFFWLEKLYELVENLDHKTVELHITALDL